MSAVAESVMAEEDSTMAAAAVADSATATATEESMVKLYFRGPNWVQHYQAPATATIEEVKKMIQQEISVRRYPIESQILRLQLADYAALTEMKDESRTLESYGLISSAPPREVSIKYTQKLIITLKFPHIVKGKYSNNAITISVWPETETVGSFKKRVIWLMMKKKISRPKSCQTMMLRPINPCRSRYFVWDNYTNYNALFIYTMFNDWWQRDRFYLANVLFVSSASCASLEDGGSHLAAAFDRISVD